MKYVNFNIVSNRIEAMFPDTMIQEFFEPRTLRPRQGFTDMKDIDTMPLDAPTSVNGWVWTTSPAGTGNSEGWIRYKPTATEMNNMCHANISLFHVTISSILHELVTQASFVHDMSNKVITIKVYNTHDGFCCIDLKTSPKKV